MINIKLRLKNKLFWVRAAIAAALPVLTSLGVVASELTSWDKLWDTFVMIVSNPFALGSLLIAIAIGIWNILPDPTTEGFGDSTRALAYPAPASTVPDDDEVLIADHQDDEIPDELSEDEDPEQDLDV